MSASLTDTRLEIDASARATGRADRVVFGGLVVLLVWLPLPWGSRPEWAAGLIGVAAGCLLCLWLLLALLGRAHLPAHSGRLWWALLAWGCWIGWIAFQALPLAPEQLARLSPVALEVHQALTDQLDVTPLFTTSIAAALTLDRLLLTLGYFALYWLVVVTACEDHGRLRALLVALVAGGVVQAVYGGLMTLSGYEYGFLAEKEHFRGVATGTFVNRNHLAGYLELASAAGIALILADLSRGAPTKRSLRRRLSDLVALLLSNKMRVRLALVLMVIAVVLTRSRLGNVAYFGSLCACGLIYVLVRERQLAVRAALLFASLILVDLLIVSKWFGLEQVVQRIERTELTTEGRTELFKELPALYERYELTGSGLGTFEIAYARERSAAMSDHFDHAHNDYAEFLIETGAVGAVLLAFLVGLHLVHAVSVILWRQRRLPPAACFATVMGVTAFAIHATGEFNLQIPANAATLVVLLAVAACCSSRSGRKDRAAARTAQRAAMPDATTAADAAANNAVLASPPSSFRGSQ